MTQARFKIKKGDTVQVTTGKEKGKRGVVSRIILSEARAIVEGVNVVTRNKKPSHANPSGPVQKNLPIHISNLALVDHSSDKPGKVGYKVTKEGDKVRYFKKTGTEL